MSNNRILLIVGVIFALLVVVGVLASVTAFVVFSDSGPNLFGERAIAEDTFLSLQDEFVVLVDDLPHIYFTNAGMEKPFSNREVILEMGVATGKAYVKATNRITGYQTNLHRKDNTDISPAVIASTVSLFGSNEGALLALSEDWFPAYLEEDDPPEFLDEDCDLGDACILYMYKEYDPVAQVTRVRYEVAFVYKNVLVWVAAAGLDIDHDETYVMDAAQAIFDRLEEAELVKQ